MPETSHRNELREAEEALHERKHELEARFLPQEFQMWEYFQKGDDDACTNLRFVRTRDEMREE